VRLARALDREGVRLAVRDEPPRGVDREQRHRLKSALVAVSLVAAPARERRAANDVDGMPALLVVAPEARSRGLGTTFVAAGTLRTAANGY
jgi:hypothetical protein